MKSDESSKSSTGSKSAAAGAGAASASKSGSTSGTKSVAPEKLHGTDWRIAEVGGQAMSTQSQATMKIGKDGTLSGSTGCNEFTGHPAMSGHTMHMGVMASTKRACEPALMSQEQRLFEEFAKVSGYSMDEKGDLHLIGTDGTTLVRLERATP